MLQPLDILKQYWNYDSFREKQEEIINNVMLGNDSFALLPTGGGKSICFQVPAVLKSGICIVVSPLIALINDQVKQLKNKGIKAIGLTSGLKLDEVDSLLDNCIYGNYKFLYLSPERLQQTLVQDRIKQMPINLIAIDEAHCISEWGNDFRPAYRNCIVLREAFPHVPIIALTASATQKVVVDIIENLQLKNVSIFKKSFERPNIAYMVFNENDKLYRLEQILKKNTGSAIVYVRNRKATINISTHLNEKGIISTFFHGGIPVYEKNKRLDEWMKDQVQVMVATNAFGMGIDKPNVKTIIHLNLPDTLESYYQEAGRCGRDGKKSYAVLLKDKNDEQQVKQQFLSVLPDVDFIKLLYNKLNNYFQISYGEGVNETFTLKFNEFCKTYNFNSILSYNGMRLLDRYSIINLSETFHKKTSIQFIVNSHQLFMYLDKNPKIEKITQTILRTYGGIFDMETKINTLLIANKLSINEAIIIKTLKQLAKNEIVTCKIQDTDAEITFLVPREDDKTINMIAKHIKQQNKFRAQKVQSVIDYINNDSICKSVQLLSYFGEKNAKPCKTCSVCISKKKTDSKNIIPLVIDDLLKYLNKEPMNSRSLTEALTFKEEFVIEALKILLEQGKIIVNNKNKYQINPT